MSCESSPFNVVGSRLLRQRQPINYSVQRKYIKQKRVKAPACSPKFQKTKYVKKKRVNPCDGLPCGCNRCTCTWCDEIKAPNNCSLCLMR